MKTVHENKDLAAASRERLIDRLLASPLAQELASRDSAESVRARAAREIDERNARFSAWAEKASPKIRAAREATAAARKEVERLVGEERRLSDEYSNRRDEHNESCRDLQEIATASEAHLRNRGLV